MSNPKPREVWVVAYFKLGCHLEVFSTKRKACDFVITMFPSCDREGLGKFLEEDWRYYYKVERSATRGCALTITRREEDDWPRRWE